MRAKPQRAILGSGELAALLGKSRRTITRWADRDLLPPTVTIGGRRYWRRSDVESWLAAGCPDVDAFEARTAAAQRRLRVRQA
jgi:excisionase family DNA binding protein